MAEFTIDGIAYKTKKLDAMTQFGIVCKLGAVLEHVKPAIQAIAHHSTAQRLAEQSGEAGPVMDLDAFVPLGRALSALPDESRDYIVGAVLRSTFRQNGPGFLPAWNARDNRPLDEIDFSTLIQILGHALKDNLGSFTPALA